MTQQDTMASRMNGSHNTEQSFILILLHLCLVTANHKINFLSYSEVNCVNYYWIPKNINGNDNEFQYNFSYVTFLFVPGWDCILVAKFCLDGVLQKQVMNNTLRFSRYT